MSELFPSTGSPVVEQEANVAAQPVEAEGSGAVEKPRTYSSSDIETIVKDRLVRERKKFDKELETVRADYEAKKPASDNEVVKGKLNQLESEKRSLSEKLTRIQTETLRSQVKSKLSEAGCVDPDLVTDHMLTKRLVTMDDDGNTVVDHFSNNLDDLVKDFLGQKPQLVKSGSKGGAGTKGPTQPNATYVADDPKTWTDDELKKRLEIRSKNNKLF